MSDYIMEYLEDRFNLDYSNVFLRDILENIVNYGIARYSFSKNQLAYFLSDMINGLEYDEISEVLREIEENKRRMINCE